MYKEQRDEINKQRRQNFLRELLDEKDYRGGYSPAASGMTYSSNTTGKSTPRTTTTTLPSINSTSPLQNGYAGNGGHY